MRVHASQLIALGLLPLLLLAAACSESSSNDAAEAPIGAAPEAPAGVDDAQSSTDIGLPPGFEESIPLVPDTTRRYVATEGERLLFAPASRIRIPSARVDAPLVSLSLTADGTQLAAPSGPEVVGWYDFTAKPGLGGNSVLSGHLDLRNYGPAVFANLESVAVGDTVEIELEDGTVIEYRVTRSVGVELAEIDMSELMSVSDVESITLITCGGEFLLDSGYSHRHVVRAERTRVSIAS